MKARPNATGGRQGEPDDVGLHQGQPVARRRAGSLGSRAGTTEHRAIDVDAGHGVAGLREWDGQPPAAHGQLEDRTIGPIGQGEVQVEVAGIVDQVEVVEPREGGRRLRVRRAETGRVDGHASQRTR